ncbi:GNAT family N-acetyltransferase [Pontibacillus yanchengensis]|uniref:GNAT family N-acetyltransferase n=2 Tax=Pontibacillus yanchengensis TaxID=462910 RepID=A0A6I5A2I9_9BACI|nr:GNAT family protein [Pontibacillus yanchengensis]MYL32611.1 GNAT family N-acetyltransferase [Pontibacillus yanchengensis]
MNPILKDIPTELETDRLQLRMPYPGDGQVVNGAIRASLQELQPWMGFASPIPSVEDTEINNREAHIKFLKREHLRYLVFLKETGEFVASTGFRHIDWNVPLEIGYWINTQMSGNGYVTEAIEKLTEFALDELCCRRVAILCDYENKKIRAVPERLGYTLEGVLRNDDLSVDGTTLSDTCVYAKVK